MVLLVLGDEVNRGDVLALVDVDKLQTTIDDLKRSGTIRRRW